MFEVYLAMLAAAGLCLWFVPETVSPRHRPAVGFTGLGIPARGRGEFIAAGAAGFAAFALLGLFTSLAPDFLATVLHEHSYLVQGAVVFLLFAVATATQLGLSRFSGRPVVLAGLATASRLAAPVRRGQVISAFFVACYAGLIIPVVGVGVLSGLIGTFPAVLAFAILLAVLCLFSLARIATVLTSGTTAGTG